MTKVLQSGDNVWRTAHADRVAFLVDGESYYGTVARAMAKARRSILVLGWDMNSKVELLRGSGRDDLPPAIGRRLAALLRRNRQLEVFLLDWDYPLVLSQERESRWFHRWPRSPRFHLHYDAVHPMGASHHQKVVLIDDSLVFCGGMDIGVGRWDSSEHRAHDARRNDAGFGDYVPAHDVMMMAEGEVARAVGDLVRDRWQRATSGKARLPQPAERSDCWPDGIEANIADVEIGISRTYPPLEHVDGIFEVEKLYVDAIASARKLLYIENQYLTSDVVVTALASRLAEEDGPEIVIALPQNNFGWFEARTIQVLHFRCIEKLRRADLHDRLRIGYPRIPELGDKQVNLHSKLMVVDDRFLRIGSSNMNNRSMRLDSECDFSIESDEPRVREAIAAFRNRLVGEHLCLEPAEVASALARTGSLVALVDERAEQTRCLGKVEPSPGQNESDFGNGYLVDPKEPLSTEIVLEAFSTTEMRRRARPRLARLAVMLLLFAALACLWRWTPLAGWLDPARIASLGKELRGYPAAPALVLAAYLLAGFLVVPVTVLILATASMFGPWLGIVYSLAGSVASALLMFAIGRMMGRGAVEELTGRRFRRISEGLRNRGLPTMIALRMLPVAPFTVVNIVVGATGVGARDFAIGTAIGMSPGIVSLSVFQAQLLEALRRPSATNVAMLLGAAAFLATTLAWLRGRLRARRQIREEASIRNLVARRS